MRFAAMLSLLFVFALVSPAGAQNFRQTVVTQLDAVASPIAGEGYHAAPEVIDRDAVIGMLEPGGASFLELSLTGGVSYGITGVCDQDCSDLDLYLFAEGESQPVVQDVEVDDYPVLMFTAPRTGRYMLSVDMEDCSEDLCYYGFRIYRK